MFQGDNDHGHINRVAKWASVVLPKVFGMELVNIEVMTRIMKMKGEVGVV